MGDFTGRVAIVTGANSGIGQAAALCFARLGATVVLVGRDPDRLRAARAEVGEVAGPRARPAAYRADFSVLDDVRELAGKLAAEYPSIDILANNAGGALLRRVTTVDGFEATMQINHLAPFLLTSLLRQRLSGGRVVNTASAAHQIGRLDPADLNSTGGSLRTLQVYGSSKQANILFAAEAARRWPDVRSFSYHPGLVRTRFGRDSRLVDTFYRIGPVPFLRTPDQGADTLVWLATAPAADLTNGGYYADRRLRRPKATARDASLAAALWESSERAVRLASGG